MKKRLYNVLRKAGVINTRSDAERLIREVRVKVDGEVIRSLEFQLNPRKRLITIDDRLIRSMQKSTYIVMNKPKGYITSKIREQGRKNVMDLIKTDSLITEEIKKSISPVGRLDMDTEGLILITNDGKLAHKILQPNHEVEKTYEAMIWGILNDEEKKKLENGIIIELEENGVITKYKTLSCKIRIINKDKNSCHLEIKIREGKKRQIRRMFDKLNHTVMELRRVKIGALSLGKIELGKYRVVPKEEAYKTIKPQP